MRLPIYQVDAFTDSLFGGNPAAVCPLEAWLPEAAMQAIAAENNLSETAFFVRDGGDYNVLSSFVCHATAMDSNIATVRMAVHGSSHGSNA
jgi:PhzF family phenazine biosynthesis protein